MPILSRLFSSPLPIGTEAPDFTATDQDGHSITLSQFRGRQNVVLVFYPGDETTICIKQLCEFRDQWGDVTKANTIIFGVNPQSAEKHRQFVRNRNFPFSLLVDKGQKVARLYFASGLIVRRTVYLIGRSGMVRFAQRGKPLPEQVLSVAE
jgi:thioredoxin-dependent peroxiredoxin